MVGSSTRSKGRGESSAGDAAAGTRPAPTWARIGNVAAIDGPHRVYRPVGPSRIPGWSGRGGDEGRRELIRPGFDAVGRERRAGLGRADGDVGVGGDVEEEGGSVGARAVCGAVGEAVGAV